METPNINASFGPNNSDSLWKITLRNIFNILLILAYLLDKVRIYDLTRICFTWAFLKSIYIFLSDFIFDDDVISAFTPCGALQMLRI